METVVAFALAAGILQVVGHSLKALKTCREVYNDGSLAEHKNTEEIARHLGKHSKSNISNQSTQQC